MDFLQKLGQNIKKLREQNHLTQAKLAELADVSISTIGRLEIGDGFLTINTLEKISKSLNIEIEELFCFKAEEKHSEYEKILIDKIIYKLENLNNEQELKFILDIINSYSKLKRY